MRTSPWGGAGIQTSRLRSIAHKFWQEGWSWSQTDGSPARGKSPYPSEPQCPYLTSEALLSTKWFPSHCHGGHGDTWAMLTYPLLPSVYQGLAGECGQQACFLLPHKPPSQAPLAAAHTSPHFWMSLPLQSSAFPFLRISQGRSLEGFPLAAGRDHHKLRGLKQPTVILLRFCRPEFQSRSHWAKIKVSAGLCSF